MNQYYYLEREPIKIFTDAVTQSNHSSDGCSSCSELLCSIEPGHAVMKIQTRSDIAPVQAVVLSVGERHAERAQSIADDLRSRGYRVDADVSGEKIGAKIRHHLWQEKVPVVAVVGDQEVEAGTVSARHRKEGDLGSITPDELAARIEGWSEARV